MKTQQKFIPEKCGHCEQTTEYLIRLDRGSTCIVMAIANAVRRLDRNRVHLLEDMELSSSDITAGFGGLNGAIKGGYMTSLMVGNVLRPKYFGLVAQVDGGGKGEYLLTPRGAQFLRGAEIEAAAVIDKKTHTKKRYWEHGGTTTISQLLKRDVPFWDLEKYPTFEILEKISEQGTLGL